MRWRRRNTWTHRFRETRRKISRAQRGVKEKISPSEETRRLWRERSKRRWATPESRKRHSIQLKGMIFTAERRRRISEALIGRKLSPEHRAKSAVAMLGKKHSPETRAKMKASHKRDCRILNIVKSCPSGQKSDGRLEGTTTCYFSRWRTFIMAVSRLFTEIGKDVDRLNASCARPLRRARKRASRSLRPGSPSSAGSMRH